MVYNEKDCVERCNCRGKRQEAGRLVPGLWLESGGRGGEWSRRHFWKRNQELLLGVFLLLLVLLEGI